MHLQLLSIVLWLILWHFAGRLLVCSILRLEPGLEIIRVLTGRFLIVLHGVAQIGVLLGLVNLSVLRAYVQVYL